MPHTFSDADETREGLSFGGDVAADTTDRFTFEMPHDGTVERVAVRIYPGPQNDLHVTPFVNREGGADSKLLQHIEKGFIDGDDDEWVWQVSKRAEEGDILGVEVTNNDSNNDYDFRVNMDVDYRAGTDSFVETLLGGLV